MKTAFKWIFRLFIVLVLLVVVLAVALKFFIDPNDYKQEIQTKIEDTIGRPVELNGQIEWSLFPWLAIAVNDVAVANEKGFKGEHMARVEQFAARVKIMPLLSRNIEVGKVVIDRGVFNLQVSKRGSKNWQGILDHLGSSPSESSEGSQTVQNNLKVEGVELKDIELNYKDAQSKLTAELKNFNLSTGTIFDSKPVDVQSSLRLLLPDSGLDVDIESTMQAENLLSDAGIRLQMTDFNMDGKLSSDSQLPLKLTLDSGAEVDLGKDTLNIPKLQVNMGEASLVTDVKGSQISKTMSLKGSYKVNAFDFNQFVKELTGTPLVSNKTLSDFKTQGQWMMQGEQLKLDDLQVSFADTQIKGKANIKNLSQLRGDFQVNINQLNVDDFLGGDSSSAGSTSTASATNSTQALEFGRLNGTVAIDKLTASGTTMDNITMRVQTNRSKMNISPLKADFYKGLLQTQVQVDTKAAKNRVKVNHKMEKIQAGALLTDVMGSELMTGLGRFDMDVNIDKPFSDMPLKTAHGRVEFVLNDGAIYGVDVFGMMNKGLSLLYPEVMESQQEGEKKTTFALMEFLANIDQGVLTSETLKLESPYLKVGGDLRINLFEQTIEGTIEPMLIDIPEQLVSDKYKKLLNLPIPVSLSGSLLEPKVSIDAKKLLLATQKQKIDEEKEKLKGKLMDSLFGKDN